MAFVTPEKLEVVYCVPGKEAEVIKIENSREAFKELLNDLIELVKYPKGKYVLVCGDSAYLRGELPNRSLRGFHTAMDRIIGPFFICGYLCRKGRKPKFVSLSDIEIGKFLEEFGEPEIFSD